MKILLALYEVLCFLVALVLASLVIVAVYLPALVLFVGVAALTIEVLKAVFHL